MRWGCMLRACGGGGLASGLKDIKFTDASALRGNAALLNIRLTEVPIIQNHQHPLPTPSQMSSGRKSIWVDRASCLAASCHEQTTGRAVKGPALEAFQRRDLWLWRGGPLEKAGRRAGGRQSQLRRRLAFDFETDFLNQFYRIVMLC